MLNSFLDKLYSGRDTVKLGDKERFDKEQSLTILPNSWNRFEAQIRKQMSGPAISYYEKSILGCGLCAWAGLWKKGSGQYVYEHFLRPIFLLFKGKKNCFFVKTL
jgi:hypothetical protein